MAQEQAPEVAELAFKQVHAAEYTAPSPISIVSERFDVSAVLFIPDPIEHQQHPLEYDRGNERPADTEPFPELNTMTDVNDPLFGHCVMHCRHSTCRRMIRRSRRNTGNRPRTECTCLVVESKQYSGLGRQSAMKPAKDITLDTQLSAPECYILETLDVDKQIQVRLADIPHFLDVLARASLVCPNNAARPPPSKGPAVVFFATLLSYFIGTLSSLPDRARSISPQALKLEITACLGPGLLSKVCRPRSYFPGLVTHILDTQELYAILWAVWDAAIDMLIRLLVLRDLRAKTLPKAEKRKRGDDMESLRESKRQRNTNLESRHTSKTADARRHR